MGWLLDEKNMRRYFFDQEISLNQRVTITGDLLHHIFVVCRQQVGHKFELLRPGAGAFQVEVLSVAKKEAVVQVLSQRTLANLKKPYVHLVLSMSKYQTMDDIIEKSVELGVKSIQPFFSDFSFIRTLSQFPMAKFDRWNKIIQGATEQSGRGDLMTLSQPIDLKDFLKTITKTSHWALNNIGLFAYEGSSLLSINQFLFQAIEKNTKMNQKIENIWIFIGSEGGFSDLEVEEFKKLDLNPVTLGEQVLRVETACLTLVSIVKYEFELM
jgi:16S rRNA (uracil1498-N3)-methyltransferase